MIFTKRFQPEVLDKWHAFFDHFNMPSKEFYDLVQGELATRKVPGLKTALVKWKEGGVLSDERQYLRLTRERYVFDICAAPFGTGYLFSYRFTELPLQINYAAILIILSLISYASFLLFNGLRSQYGVIQGTSVFLAAVLVCIIAVRVVIESDNADIDSMLLQIPGIGPLYDRYFRKHTYYREDTRLMYLATVPAIVKKLTEKVTVADGVKQPEVSEAKPVLQELAGVA